MERSKEKGMAVTMNPESTNLLEVKHLTTEFETEQGTVQAVRDVSFTVKKGEILGIVGESGSGKSQAMYSVMGLLARNGVVKEGSMLFDGHDISPLSFEGGLKAYDKYMQGVRGNTLSMIFQDPMSFLNPVLNIETQLVEPMLNHMKISRKEAREKAIELLRQVGIPSPETRLRQYPHEFSGGMRQRIIIAIALACNPKLIIADEPTTALDVTIQAKILQLIKDMQRKSGSSVILITHDLGVVANMCSRIVIMYGGKIVEVGTADEIFFQPHHPYTSGLLACVNNPEEEDKELQPIPGSPPDLLKPPAGCPFVDRCSCAMRICKDYMPEMTELSPTHRCACWLEQKKEVLA